MSRPGGEAAVRPAPTEGDPGTSAITRAPESRSPLVVLLGRPNSGKSSLYNAITGGSAHVGNFPGITVDILEADVTLPSGAVADVADLPGLYSIDAVVDPHTDEGVARLFLDRLVRSGRPFVVVQVIDSTQLALGLRLTRELTRRALPLVVVATQRDVLDAEGHALDADALAHAIGAPVAWVSARDAQVKAIVLGLADAMLRAPAPSVPSSAAPWDADTLARRVVTDRSATSPEAVRRRTFTARVDEVLLHPVVGPIVFLSAMALLFAAVFLIADPVTAILDAANAAIGARIEGALGAGLLSSFLVDGVLGGAGTVLAFMPQIVILTLAMELLEASGYLARGAFLVDRALRFLGLSGRSFLPLLMGHACAVPAISATRIIRDPRERLTTILVLPLMTCSARIPTYALVLSTFFAGRGVLFRALVFVGLYACGVGSGLVASLVLRRSATKGRTLPLVLEMPKYRAPQVAVVVRQASRAAGRFLREVGTTILAASAILWCLLTVPMPGTRAAATTTSASDPAAAQVETPRIERSIAAGVGRALEPVTRPMGFDWRINVGLVGSFGARELMVSTMGIIFGLENAGDDPAPLSERMRAARSGSGDAAHPAYSTRTGLAILAFFVLACQCMSTLAAIRRETKTLRWPAFVLAYTYVVAYAAALVVYQVSGWLGVT